MHRRSLLVALPALAGLAACTTTSSGVTIDVARINTDGSAILTALSAATAAPSVSALLADSVAAVQSGITEARSILDQINTAAGGALTLSVNTSSVQSLVTSFVANVQSVLSIVQSIVSRLDSPTATTIGNYVSAILTLLPLVQLAAGLLVAAAAAPRGMTEAQALAVAQGKR